ncbi:MAG: class I SAM-dependent methyltransferase [Bosea sp.]|nr:class I SAM-dependent methyltransferase [Bosea sp. (in: a-proteobacteria)]
MSFDVAAEAYDRFMGRFSQPLAEEFATWARLPESGRALDVGCGPGALVAVLATRLGERSVSAIDPSASFVAAARERFPAADVREASAEDLPFPDASFDATLAALVVHFMTDAAVGVREMVRVTRPGGVVAACVWDFAGGRAPQTAFFRSLSTVADDGDGISPDDLARVLLPFEQAVPLATRPVLFALARCLAEAWPADASRQTLLTRAFRAKEADESHRARLRVEIGRLRAALHGLAQIDATGRGFVLKPHRADAVVVLARPREEPHEDVLALLADGEAWSSSALALALDTSQRNMQRMLEALAAAGRIQSFGKARARRWLTPPVPGFPTSLLLPAPPSDG